MPDTAPAVQDSSSAPPPDVSGSFLSQAAAPPPQMQSAPTMPQYDPSQEVQTERGESWATGGGGGHDSWLGHILHVVGDAIAPRTAPTVDSSGNIVNTPQ